VEGESDRHTPKVPQKEKEKLSFSKRKMKKGGGGISTICLRPLSEGKINHENFVSLNM
jgi:hypothetical protein